MKDNLYVITIGRQLGSGGKLIGERLSEQLGIPCYDKELLLIASQESGLCKNVFEKVDEQSRYSFWGGGIFSSRSGYFAENTNNCLGNEALFKIQSDVIRMLAEKASCIFVGRCADYILREHPRMLRVFICADIKKRIDTLTATLGIVEKEAQTLIEQTDKKRAEYYNYYSNKTWGSATSYDMCLNASVFGIEETAALISDTVVRRFK